MYAGKIFLKGIKSKIFLTSDHHLDSVEHYEELLNAEMNEAAIQEAKILINGDWSSSLLPHDFKRFTNSSAYKAGQDNLLNCIIDNAFEYYKPYVEFIEMIGCGNHETAVIKHNSIDPTQILIYKLNEIKKNGQIQYGGYTGFISIILDQREYVIYYNHGQGGGAAVTKGMIDLSRRNNVLCDLVWLGHKHTKIMTRIDPMYYLDPKGIIKERRRYGVITGGYEKNIDQEMDLNNTGYNIKYGETTMRTPQEYGGVILTLESKRSKNDTRYIAAKVEDIAF